MLDGGFVAANQRRSGNSEPSRHATRVPLSVLPGSEPVLSVRLLFRVQPDLARRVSGRPRIGYALPFAKRLRTGRLGADVGVEPLAGAVTAPGLSVGGCGSPTVA